MAQAMSSGLWFLLPRPPGTMAPFMSKFVFSLACTSVSHVIFFSNIIFFSPIIESTSVARSQITRLTHGHSTHWTLSKLCYVLTRRYDTHPTGGRREGLISLSRTLPIFMVSGTFFRPFSREKLPCSSLGPADVLMLHTQQNQCRSLSYI